MVLRLHDTRSGKTEVFEPLRPGEVRMYVCGPSTYDHAHVGHARSYLIYDVLRRLLEHEGYAVKHVMNFTDVEEEIARRAEQAGLGPLEFAETFIRSFRDDMAALHILPAHATPRVSQMVPDIVDAVSRLLDEHVAYQEKDTVYFDVTRAPGYGALGGPAVADLAADDLRARGDRHHALDFILWRASDDWGLTWSSPWGVGRPGWHIECTVMALAELGPEMDIHGGGMDLTFPHHASEAAIAQALTGRPYCHVYLHNGFVTRGTEKMGKSKGNFVVLKDLLKGHDAEALRAYLLDAHYRAPLPFREEDLEAWEDRLDRWRGVVEELQGAVEGPPGELPDDLQDLADATFAALDDDLHLGRSLEALGGFLDRLRDRLDGDEGITAGEASAAWAFLGDAAAVLGLFWDAFPDA